MSINEECLWLDGFFSALSTICGAGKYSSGAMIFELSDADLVGSLSRALGDGELELIDSSHVFDEPRLIENMESWLEVFLQDFLNKVLCSKNNNDEESKNLVEYVRWKIIEGIYRVCDFGMSKCFILNSVISESYCSYIIIPALDKHLVLVFSEPSNENKVRST